MAPSVFVKKLMWEKAMKKKTRFPGTLLKTLKRTPRMPGESYWIKGIRGYSYYPVDEVEQWILHHLPLSRKRHRILPRPEIQQGNTCLIHALINALEARLRLILWKRNPSDDLPRLSIQQALDIVAPLRNEDLVYNFLGINRVKEVLPMGPGEVGVTTAANWPFRAEEDPKRLLQYPPVPRDVLHWERFKLEVGTDEIYEGPNYDGRDEKLVNYLIKRINEEGPIVAWYDMYSSHTPYTVLESKGDKLVTYRGEDWVHTVNLTGHKKWRNRRTNELEVYWEFMNNGGVDWGRGGFGRIAFQAIRGVEIPTPLVDWQ